MFRTTLSVLALCVLSACAAPPLDDAGPGQVTRAEAARYEGMWDDGIWVPPVDGRYLGPDTVRREVAYWSDEPPGTIVVDPYARYLYLIQGDNRALRYAVAVGEAGKAFSGNAVIAFGREWPRWTPTRNMLRSDPELYEPHRGGMEGGLENPLGARALYLYRNGRDTLYRIHGTPYPWSVGRAASSGCIRLYQQDIIDLYQRVGHEGTRVKVLNAAQSGEGTGPLSG
ncbi:L,D-transpeptidase [Mangrovicoccus algicola]|uniref:L,D-transpeptidase n=1 Tax=Mangrovicoccus algicola TaxID=2771008 RepID=A0A8J7CII9_9RHOB|nr:L,D-transpeptidase [Mangrovicoccus algicola]MBE3639600.1 L,D-transpeptidase [Mangrovicoccus algicola]